MTFADGLVLDRVEIALAGRRLVAIDRRIAPGAVLAVTGPSGAGKSSLLAFLGGFLAPPLAARGRIGLEGRDITALPPEKRRIGLLFQDALLFPHLSVGGNLLFGLGPRTRGRARRRAAADAMLEKVGLAGFFGRDPATLSGGEAARVALARTLLSDPRALLLDEAFSRLDRDLRASVRTLVFGLVCERQIPAILVTHDREDAEGADDIVHLDPGGAPA